MVLRVTQFPDITQRSREFAERGYIMIEGLLSQNEVQELIDLMMEMHAGGPIPEVNFNPLTAEAAGGDILKQYPRIMHPHRVNATARHYLLHPKVLSVLRELFDEDPLAAQSMFYFKPPGAKGQALHQDNFFLKAEPDTCIAAWVALDSSDEENGGLLIVPGTHGMEIVCPETADSDASFTKDEVRVPEGLSPIPVLMGPGDVLFFNGSIVHGSYPNTSKKRWRRAFIGHYVGASTTRIGHFYNPLYTADDQIVRIRENTDSGPCGVEFDAAESPMTQSSGGRNFTVPG